MSCLNSWKLKLPCYLIPILSCFLFFLITDLYLLIPAVIIQIFNATAELSIPIGVQPNDAKAEIETQPVIIETKISKCLM